MEYMMVLNDGETFTNLAGCGIVAVPDGSSIEVIEELLDLDDGSMQVGHFQVIDGQPAFVHSSNKESHYQLLRAQFPVTR